MVRIHPLPAGEAASGDFSAVIGGERATPWLCRVSAMPYNTVWPGHQRPLEQTEPASFLSFEMQEPVEVRLTANRPFAEAVVRPLNQGRAAPRIRAGNRLHHRAARRVHRGVGRLPPRAAPLRQSADGFRRGQVRAERALFRPRRA